MAVILQDLYRIPLTNQFHAAHQQASGPENFDVIGSEFNTGFPQRVHDLPTKAFAVRVGAEFDPVARALKDSPGFIWGYIHDRSFLQNNHKNRF
jgi:hypothetical protein